MHPFLSPKDAPARPIGAASSSRFSAPLDVRSDTPQSTNARTPEETVVRSYDGPSLVIRQSVRLRNEINGNDARSVVSDAAVESGSNAENALLSSANASGEIHEARVALRPTEADLGAVGSADRSAFLENVNVPRVFSNLPAVVRFDPLALIDSLGNPSLDPNRFSFNLALNGELVATTERRIDARFGDCRGYPDPDRSEGPLERTPSLLELRLLRDPESTRLPLLFSDAVGFAELSVVARGPQGTFAFAADPVLVLVPEGKLAQNLYAMANFIAVHYSSLLALDNEEESQSLEARISQLESLIRVFEHELPYFRANARYRVHTSTVIAELSKAHAPAPSAHAYLSAHPEELVPATASTGIRAGRRFYSPRHVPVETVTKSGDTYENLAIEAFLRGLSTEVADECASLEALLATLDDFEVPEGYVSPSRPLLQSRFAALRRSLARLTALGEFAKRLGIFYRNALAIAPKTKLLPCGRANRPRRTAVFREIGPYRRLYEAMLMRFAEVPPLFEREKALRAFLDRSRFYEVFALMKVLAEITGAGWTLTQKTRWIYDDFLNTTNASLKSANTFVFERPDDKHRITVYYEPVLKMAGKAPVNGIGLVRTSALAFNSALGILESLRGSDPSRAVLTPDIVVCVAEGKDERAPRRWFVADAKYGAIQSVFAKQSLALAFKYLMSVTTASDRERFEGVWLLCAKTDGSPLPPQSLNAYGLMQGMPAKADLHFELLTGLDQDAEDGNEPVGDQATTSIAAEAPAERKTVLSTSAFVSAVLSAVRETDSLHQHGQRSLHQSAQPQP